MACEYYEKCPTRKTLIDLTLRKKGKLESLNEVSINLKRGFCQSERPNDCPQYKYLSNS